MGRRYISVVFSLTRRGSVWTLRIPIWLLWYGAFGLMVLFFYVSLQAAQLGTHLYRFYLTRLYQQQQQALQQQLQVVLSDYARLSESLLSCQPTDQVMRYKLGITGTLSPTQLEPTPPENSNQMTLGKWVADLAEAFSCLQDQVQNQQQRYKDYLAEALRQANERAHIPSIEPIENMYITSRFGVWRSLFSKGRQGGPKTQRRHPGIDIAADLGHPIRATADGVVYFAGWSQGYGKLVILDHGNDHLTYYGHASKLGVKEGDRVRRGDIIAWVGRTGRATGYHLHYEVRRQRKPINPFRYILPDEVVD